MASIISAGTTSGTALNMAGDTSGVLQLATNGSTTAVTIDTSQNVGIGTSSPVNKLNVANSGVPAAGFYRDLDVTIVGTAGQRIEFGARNGATFTPGAGITGSLDNPATTGGLEFLTRSSSTLTERMRIDSNGNVLVGATSGGSGTLRVSGGKDAFLSPYNAPSAGYFSSTNSADANCVEIFQGRFNKAGLTMSANNSGTVIQVEFFQTGSSRGSISTNNSVTAYNTSSDYRLKENIAPMTGALDKVAQLKPVTFTWKETGNQSQGFIAHELAEVVPDCVTGEKDAVETYTNEDGIEQTRIKPQGVDASFLVATLTAAIQEQQTIINDLKARITALEGAA